MKDAWGLSVMASNEWLNKDSSVSIHIRNIQRVATEMFKSYKGSLPPIMDNVFKLKRETPYSLKSLWVF